MFCFVFFSVLLIIFVYIITQLRYCLNKTFNGMDNIQQSNKTKKKETNNKQVKMSHENNVDVDHKNINAILDRKKISGNWEIFLQNQTESSKKNKDGNVQTTRNNNSHWKTKRLEKKHNLQTVKNTSNNVEDNKTNENADNTLEDGENAVGESSSVVCNGRIGTLTRCVAIDCEMVGVGPYGRDSILARVSIVNKFGDCIYDKFVKAREKVTDYRTPVSGVRKEDLARGESFEVVQREVAELIKGRVLVGHALKKDLEVLFLSHPKRYIRDTSKYKPFRKLAKGGTPSLKNLSRELLGVKIQGGEHSSVEDARATMQLYAAHQRQWESAVRRKKGGTNAV